MRRGELIELLSPMLAIYDNELLTGLLYMGDDAAAIFP